MADEKLKNLTGADSPGKAPAQPEAGGSPEEGTRYKERKVGAENSRSHEKGEILTGWKGSQSGENAQPQKPAR